MVRQVRGYAKGGCRAPGVKVHRHLVAPTGPRAVPKRTARVPQGSRGGWARLTDMGTKRTAPQLRLADVRRWRPYRTHRQAGRPQWHPYDRDRLPQADSPVPVEGAHAMDRIFPAAN